MQDQIKKNLMRLKTYLDKVKKTKMSGRTLSLLNKYAEDKGKEPWVVNIEDLTIKNDKFRSTKWTGEYFQLTTMSIDIDEDIGLEVHDDVDQFLRIEQGTVEVSMGKDKENMDTWTANPEFAIFIPAGIWHNVKNVGDDEVKLYSIYAKPEHPEGTEHDKREDDPHHQQQ